MKGTAQGGEIVQVQGGHILRATGRKDRHSKVYTSKGPRDRRVRLSAHTAIQFYDVQDRLGYDRPSKAIDWLIGKAKASIDRLNQLQPWQPAAACGGNPNPSPDSNPSSSAEHVSEPPKPEFPPGIGLIHSGGNGFNPTFEAEDTGLVNTMKSFFPTTEDLGLSLHSLQDGHGNSENPFQECFQRIDGWSQGGGSVGFPTNQTAAMYSHHQGLSVFSHRELLQSNTLGDHHHQMSWNPHRPLVANSMGHQNPAHPRGCQSSSSEYGSPFEFGYSVVPSRIYREEEPDSHV